MSAIRRPGTLFISLRGRVGRSTFLGSVLLLAAAFAALFALLERTAAREATLLLYPPFYWALLAVAVKRYHDLGRSGVWLLVLIVPLLGPAFAAWELGLRRGGDRENRYGEPPHPCLDYMTNP